MFHLWKNSLAAKGPNTEDLIEIIVIVAIIGIGVLKALTRGIKRMAEKKSDQSKYTPATTPARPKKRYVAADGSYKTLEQLREEKIAQIRAAFGIPEPKEPRTISIEKPAPMAAAAATERPVRHPKRQKPVARTAAAPTGPRTAAETEGKKVHAAAAVPAGKTAYDMLFSSQQDLRNAILYQEILGKPLALRDTA